MMALNILTTPNALTTSNPPLAPDAPPELPAGLADPLHLPKAVAPWMVGCGCLVLLLLAVLLVLWGLYRLGKRVKAKPRAAKPPPPPRARAGGIGSRIEALAEEFTADPRQGCHQLAAMLRDHFEADRRERLDHLTAREIGSRLGDGKIAKLLLQLAGLQFGRDEPSPRAFRGICRDARWLVEGQRGRRSSTQDAEETS